MVSGFGIAAFTLKASIFFIREKFRFKPKTKKTEEYYFVSVTECSFIIFRRFISA